jgi:DNA-binding CsgD family transcriptional regulator/tetratricopeptide (TPR) repeat protein
MRLLERDDELGELGRALTTSHPQGRIAAVSGEAGVGKTALLHALAERHPGASFLWGSCDALTTPRPLGPLFDLAPELGDDIEALVTATVPRHQVFAAFAAAVARRKPPVSVIFEDVHWADEATLDLLRYLSRRISRIGALVVITWRADEVGADHSLHRLLGELPAAATHRIDLQPLSIEAVTRIAGEGHDGPAMFALTNGNPFFVTELIRSGGERIPASVREAILARRASLPAEARQVVDLVSVVPARAEIEIVRANVTAVTDALLPAVDVGLLTFDGRALGFRHELARLAVLESLPLLRVQELHRMMLAGLSGLADRPGVLARLVHHAGGAADSDAVQRFAVAAARQAAALGAHREAAAHYRTALAFADTLEPAARAEIEDLLSYECYLTGDIAAARDAKEDALALWRQQRVPRAIGRDLRWLSRLAWFLGDHRYARQCAQEALDVLAPLGEDEELAWALSNSAQLHMLAHEHELCMASGLPAIDLARRLGSVEVLSHALNNVGSSLMEAGDPSGRRMQEESLSIALDHDLHEHAARAFTNLATCSIHVRDYDFARRWLDRGINYCYERDLDSWGVYLLAYRARLLAETGHWADAEHDAARVLRTAGTLVVAKIPALTTLGLIHARQGKADAERLLDDALALALPTAENQRLIPVRAARAELALLQGRTDAASAQAQAGLTLLTSTDLPWDWEILRYLKWRADGAMFAPCCDVQLLDGSPRPFALQMRGDWRAAADAWRRIGCPYEHAQALADGDVPAMEQALEIFLGLGAAPAADRVRHDLRRVGVNRLRRGPRSTTRAHPAGLTKRESEILALLARNLSNPAIGGQLFVSPKTVEHHVSSILGKLDVSSRDEAVVEARRRGWLADAASSSAK